MARPALQSRTSEAIDLCLQVRVAEYRAVESKRVCRSCARAERAMCIESLRSTEEVPQLGMHISIGLGCARLRARLDGVVAALVRGDIDINIGGRR